MIGMRQSLSTGDSSACSYRALNSLKSSQSRCSRSANANVLGFLSHTAASMILAIQTFQRWSTTGCIPGRRSSFFPLRSATRCPPTSVSSIRDDPTSPGVVAAPGSSSIGAALVVRFSVESERSSEMHVPALAIAGRFCLAGCGRLGLRRFVRHVSDRQGGPGLWRLTGVSRAMETCEGWPVSRSESGFRSINISLEYDVS